MLKPVAPHDFLNLDGRDDTPDAQRRIRALNDALRIAGGGGLVVESLDVQALPDDVRREVFRTVQRFEDFNGDNDPYKERDCAVVRVDGQSYVFKTDYYDENLEYHSPDKSSLLVTRRVLTICTASER